MRARRWEGRSGAGESSGRMAGVGGRFPWRGPSGIGCVCGRHDAAAGLGRVGRISREHRVRLDLLCLCGHLVAAVSAQPHGSSSCFGVVSRFRRRSAGSFRHHAGCRRCGVGGDVAYVVVYPCGHGHLERWPGEPYPPGPRIVISRAAAGRWPSHYWRRVSRVIDIVRH